MFPFLRRRKPPENALPLRHRRQILRLLYSIRWLLEQAIDALESL